MHITVTLDDELIAQAQALTGLEEMSSLIHLALQALIERERARRLTLLGVSAPKMADIPRR